MKQITVLMVDDEIDFITPLSKRLGKRGFNILLAENGQAGLDLLENVAVDVVLLDITMPGMDGIKTLREIRRCHPVVEVIILTARNETDLVISGLGMGAYDYLVKPVELKELARKIEDAAQRRKKPMSAPRP